MRVGARDQLFQTLLHTLHRIRGGYGNRRSSDDQLSVADGLLDACDQLLAPLAVLPLLGIENMALRIGQRRARTQPDVLIRLNMQPQILIHPSIVCQHHPELVTPHGLGHNDLTRQAQGGGDVVHRQQLRPAVGYLIQQQLVLEVPTRDRMTH